MVCSRGCPFLVIPASRIRPYSSFKCRASTRLRRAGYSLCLCKESNQRNTPRKARPPGIRQLLLRCSTSGIHAVACPAGARRRSGGSLSVRPCTPANSRASCARPFGLFLRAFAAPYGAPVGRRPAAEAGASIRSESTLKRRSSRRSPGMDGFVDHGTVRGAEHRSPCRISPKGRGDGSPRLRSSTWMYCLSNPARARSAGKFGSPEANQTTASGA